MTPSTPGFSAESAVAGSSGAEPHGQKHPHHVSVLAAGTRSESAEDATTLGVDYEYRVSDFLGVGFVAEHTGHPLEITTLVAAADLHLWEGLAIQTGPGVAFEKGEAAFVYRFGLLYEFELGHRWTLSPQIHWDDTRGQPDELIYGLAFGRSF